MYKVLKFINGKTTNIFENIDFKDVEHIKKMCTYWFEMVRNSKAAQFLIIENDRIIKIIDDETKS